MADETRGVDRLRRALGHRPLNRVWAKAEIVLGLTGAGVGLLVGGRGAWVVGEVDWLLAAVGVALFVLGGYLAMAGHRSHLYQSANELAGFLTDEIQAAGSPPPSR